MAKFLFPHLGEVNSEDLEEYYEVEMYLNSQEIEIDLNFENKTIDIKGLNIAKQFIENIAEFDKKNKKYIKEDYADPTCDTVKTYVEHHLENIDKNELSELIDFDNSKMSPAIQLMNSLRLIRIGIYPDREEDFATFDYSINPEITDDLVVIFTFPSGEMNYMTLES